MSDQGEAQAVDAFKSNVEDLALEELSRLGVRREAVASELAAIDASLKSVCSVLGAVVPKPAKQAKKKSGSKNPISASVRERFIAWATGREGDITAAQISEALGIGQSYGNIVAKQMREEGLLRLSATSGTMNIYRSEV